MPSRTSVLYRRLGGASRPSCRSQCSRSQALRFGNLHACRRVAEGLAARRRRPRSGGHGQNRTAHRTALQRHSSAWNCRALGTPAGTTMAGVDVFVETDRLVLRRVTRGDLELLVELDSNPEVKRYIDNGAAVDRNDLAETLEWWLGYYDRFGGYGFWAAIEKSTGLFGRLVPLATRRGRRAAGA